MGYIGEGTVTIPMEEFWEFVEQYLPGGSGEIAYGVPRVNTEDDRLEVDFAVNTDCHPSDQHEKPEPLQQWDRLFSSKQNNEQG